MFTVMAIIFVTYGFIGCAGCFFEKEDNVVVLDAVKYCFPAFIGVWMLMLQ